MQTYAIHRRNAFRSQEDLGVAASRATEVGAEFMTKDVRLIRSYAVTHPDGKLGTVSIYQAFDIEALRKHVMIVNLRTDEILPVSHMANERPAPHSDAFNQTLAA